MKQLGCLIAILWSATAWAQEPAGAKPSAPEHKPGTGYTVGDFHFAPRVKVKSQFDDNIFLENDKVTEEDDDLYFILNPSAGVTFNPGDEFTASLQYALTQWWAMNHSTAHRTEHDVGMAARWQPTSLFYLRTSNRFVDAVQPIDAAVTNQVEILAGSYSIAPGLQWQNDTLEFEINYRRLDSGESVTAKDIIRFFEHDVWTMTLREQHRWTEKFSTTVELAGGWTDFWGGATGRIKQDNVFWGPRLIAQFEVSEEVQLAGAIEYNHRNYRRDTGATTFTDDFEGWLFSVDLGWRPDADNRFSLGGGRRVAESPISNFTHTYFANVGYTHVIVENLAATIVGTAAFGQESNDLVAQNKKITWSGELLLHWQFEPGWLAEAGAEYRDKRTVDMTGEYENWRATLGVGYTF